MLIPLLMDLGMFGGDVPPEPVIDPSGVPGGSHRNRTIRLTQLSDGDRRTTAEFIKAHISQTPERVAFTQASMLRTLTQDADETIIAVILSSDL